MPKGTKVERMYQGLKKHGYSEGSAARIAQAQTGLALATGKPPKDKPKGKRRFGIADAGHAAAKR